MEEKAKDLYINYPRKDYSMSFKLAVVRVVESGATVMKVTSEESGFKGTKPQLDGVENIVPLKRFRPCDICQKLLSKRY